MDVSGNSKFRRACVFCGSSVGNRKCYEDATVELAEEMVRRRIDLVYGGGSLGLMGLISRTVDDAGGHVIGIMPKTLMDLEFTGETVGEAMCVADMHQRKTEMLRRSDCFIALPGGYGTVEEVLEVISGAQLGIHDKPVGLLNVDGYYDYLLTFMDKAVEDGFLTSSQRGIIISATNAKELIQKFEEYVPEHDWVFLKEKWEGDQHQHQQTHLGLNSSSPIPHSQISLSKEL